MHRLFIFSLWSSLLGLLAGCSVLPAPQDDPTRYFVLTGPQLTDENIAKPTGSLRLGVKTVRLPEYLRGRGIAVRHGTNELAYHDYALWAEPLDAGLARVVRAQLAASPAIDRVYSYPFPFDERRDFDVSLTVIHCEAVRTTDGRNIARLSAVIEITTADEEARVVTRKLFTAPDAPWDGSDFGALANRLSEAVAALGQEIIEALPEQQ